MCRVWWMRMMVPPRRRWPGIRFVFVELAQHGFHILVDKRGLEVNVLGDSCRGSQQGRQQESEMHAAMDN